MVLNLTFGDRQVKFSISGEKTQIVAKQSIGHEAILYKRNLPD
jgi:phosphatidate phosphatase PAH1